MRRTALYAAAALAALLDANVAFAAACCGDDGGLGQRLALDERAASSLSFALAERVGGYDGQGLYHRIPSGDADHALRLDAAWAVRAASRLEIGADIPVLIDVRTLGTAHASGGGVGDISAYGRVAIAQIDDTTLWPALYVTTSVFVPTGRPAELSTHLGADVTGQGVGEVRTTLTIAKSFSARWFGQLDGALSFFTPSETGGVPLHRGPRLFFDVVAGPLFSIGVRRGAGFGVGFAYEAEGPPSTAPLGVKGVRLARITAAGSVDVTTRVSIIGSFASAVPASGLGANDIAAVAISLGARYAFDVDD